MNIILNFDNHLCGIYVPDGYLQHNSFEIQEHFLEWIYTQSNCTSEDKWGNLAFNYDEEDFLKYINNVILADSREKAYIIKDIHKIRNESLILKF